MMSPMRSQSARVSSPERMSVIEMPVADAISRSTSWRSGISPDQKSVGP
jgi:hypothetical protein